MVVMVVKGLMVVVEVEVVPQITLTQLMVLVVMEVMD
jgi:hypothetical protein